MATAQNNRNLLLSLANVGRVTYSGTTYYSPGEVWNYILLCAGFLIGLEAVKHDAAVAVFVSSLAVVLATFLIITLCVGVLGQRSKPYLNTLYDHVFIPAFTLGIGTIAGPLAALLDLIIKFVKG